MDLERVRIGQYITKRDREDYELVFQVLTVYEGLERPTYKEAGEIIGMHPTAVSYHVRKTKEERTRTAQRRDWRKTS